MNQRVNEPNRMQHENKIPNLDSWIIYLWSEMIKILSSIFIIDGA